MFKCKECGLEYKEKPDYCECGNDEFETIMVADSAPKESEKKSEPVITQQKTTENQEFISQNEAKQQNYKSRISRFSIEPISTVIFIICLILSAYVIFFAWNPKETPITKSTEQISTNKNIPSIDKFWNNAVPVIKQEPIKEEPTIVEEVKKIIQPIQKKAPEKKTTTTPKTTTVKLNKSTPKTTTTKSKPTQTTKTETKQTAKPVQTTPQKTDAQIAAEKALAAQKAAEAAEKAAQEKALAAQKAAAEKQELINYKAKLRNTIGRKIDFTKVVGDGNCTVAFKINSSGKLVNRSFAQQSSNITLNDAVYAAMMSTPSYNPPPSGYNNETLNLIIRFYNGNYEITLR